MSASVIAGVTLIAVAAGLGAWMLVSSVDPVRKATLANLNRGVRPAGPTVDEDRVVENEHRGLGALARRVTPDGMIRLLDRQHAQAGRPAAWPVDRLLVLKLLYLPIALLADVVLVIGGRTSPLLALLGLVTSLVIYFLPELLLYSRGMERRETIQLELADTLDQMTIAVEAGLGFDSAMARAAQNGKGPLAEELTRTLQDIRMGQSRRQAFEALARRTNVVDLRRFIRAILQADAFGISIGDVLRTQANEMRLKRRQRAEEQAQKIPVKVLMPLMTCILPVLFIVVIGPAALNMIDAFGGL